MSEPRPRREVRRFDVFAEYRKQEQEAAGVPTAHAKGYGLWVAKVVAGRRFGGAKRREAASAPPAGMVAAAPERATDEWHELDGVPQTDTLFDHEIVERMGEEFYRREFAPAIAAARVAGKSYEAIRDNIRRGWKPA